MNKKISIGAAISLIAIASAITFILTSTFSLDMYNNKIADVNQRAEVYKKLNEIETYISDYFYGTVSHDEILDAVSNGYIGILDDKYARYSTVEENEQSKNSGNGILVGVGITASQDESGYILINSVNANSPAESMGLMAGQLVVAVDGVSVISAGYSASVAAISGEAGKRVTLTIRKDGADSDVMLTREEIEIVSVTSKMIGELGYIKITSFNNKTTTQFKLALENVQNQGATGIIFDLRNNGGGLLTPTLDMLDVLLPEGEIASSIDKAGKVTVLKESNAAEINLPMVILVNSRTASASELFSSALRDYGKAQLVGTTTYGKGVMQTTYELLDGSSITFTTSAYKTPKTDNFNGIGLKPNFEVKMTNDTDADLAQLDETTDSQLKKAIAVLKTTTQAE